MHRLVTLNFIFVLCSLFLGDPFPRSVIAGAYDNPHGPYSAFPTGCAACHVAHAGLGAKLMVRNSVTTLCLTCHDGTASVFNVVYVAAVDREVYGFGFGESIAGAVYHPTAGCIAPTATAATAPASPDRMVPPSRIS